MTAKYEVPDLGDVHFVDDLPGKKKYKDWKPVLDAVAARPGEWAEVSRIDTRKRNTLGGIAWHLKAGRMGGYEPNDFEAVTRSVTEDEVGLFIRYVGSPASTGGEG